MVGTAGAIIITVLVLAVAGAVGYIAYSRWRAQKLGLPPPSITSFLSFGNKSSPATYGASPRPGGIQGWLGDQVTKFKNRNKRTATGAYEGAPMSRGVGGPQHSNTSRVGGFGALDPDAAWDARVGDEVVDYGGAAGYDEEHELGLGPYGRNSSAFDGVAHGGRGGPLGGSLGSVEDSSYAMNLAATPRMAPVDGGARVGRNPFDDDAAEPSNLSLRGVSPRPMEGEHHGKGGDNSPTERRSIFKENV